MNKPLISLTLAGVVMAASGCVTSRIEELKIGETGIGVDESVVVLVNRQNANVEAEKGFSDCLNTQLARGSAGLNVLDPQEFKDQLFPWFEPRLRPPRADGLDQLLLRPGVSERIVATGVRYLIWVDGSTQVDNKAGSMTCAFSPGGGGCFGILTWDNNSSYEASIWDLRRGESAGVISADATGTSVIPALLVPLPFLARTKTASCKGLADQIKQFVVSEEVG